MTWSPSSPRHNLTLSDATMNVDEAGPFVPEHLAKWLKVTRGYLLAPLSGSQHAEEAEVAQGHPAVQGQGGRGVLLSWALRALLHLAKRAAHGEDDPLKALESGIYFHVSLMAKHPSVPVTILDWYSQTGDARVRSRIRSAIGHYEKRLTRLIGQAKEQGLVKASVDAPKAAGVLVGMIQGLALRMHAGISQPDMLLQEAATVFPVYLDGIRAASTPGHSAAFI